MNPTRNRLVLLFVGLVLVATVYAQRPAVMSTLVTTDTGATSICVGGNDPGAPTTCTGGMKFGTPLTVSGVSNSNSISGGGNQTQSLTLTNTTSGTTANSAIGVTAGTTSGSMTAFSQGYSTNSGNIASTLQLYSGAAGGIVHVAGDAAGMHRWYNVSTERMRLHASGGLSVGNTTDDGAGTVRAAGTIKSTGQPGFLAYNSASDTGQSSGATVDFDTEVYDELGNFSADTFTAPVTGRYLLCGNVYLIAPSAAGSHYLELVTTARTYSLLSYKEYATAEGTGHEFSVIADMAAGDTAFVRVQVTGTVTVYGGSPAATYFSGRLLP